METATKARPLATLERLVAAQNAHDLAAFVACFQPDYQSEQPAHPARAFKGSEQVRKNWSAIFAGVPDFRSDLLRSAVDGDTAWAEMHWTGTKVDGTPFDQMGIIVFGVREDRIAWGRLYFDEVEREGEDIDQAMRRIAGSAPTR